MGLRDVVFTGDEGIFGSLSEAQSAVVLENLLFRDRIDHHDETILKPIAKNYPG